MTEEEIENGLASPDLEIRKKFAVDKRFRLTKSQIERGLKDKSPIIRYIFASRYSDMRNHQDGDEQLTSVQFRRGLKDPNDSVRAVFARNNKFTSKEDMDDIMQDQSAEVKMALTYNPSIRATTPEVEEIVRIYKEMLELTSTAAMFASHERKKNKNIYKGMINDLHSHFKNLSINIEFYKLNAYELERGLTSHLKNIRKIFAYYAYMHRGDFILTQGQLDRGLTDEDAFIRNCFYNSIGAAKFFSDKQIKRGLKDKCPLVRAYFIENRDIDLTEDNVIDITEDDSHYVKSEFIRRRSNFLPEKQVDQCLRGKDSDIKLAIISSVQIQLTEEQKKCLLKDKDASVRCEFVKRYGHKLTPEQTGFILENDTADVRTAIFESKYINMNPKHISVRCEFIKRRGNELTPKQIEAILKNDTTDVKSAILENKHINMTPEHISLALNDESTRIRTYVIGSDRFSFSPSQIENGLNDANGKVVAAFIRKEGVIESLSQEKINWLFNRRTSSFIKMALIEKDVSFTEEQIDTIIGDGDHRNTRKLLTRNDINLTSSQIERLLEYPTKEVVDILEERSDYIEYKKNKPRKGFNRI